jgi:hypothetical protein
MILRMIIRETTVKEEIAGEKIGIEEIVEGMIGIEETEMTGREEIKGSKAVTVVKAAREKVLNQKLFTKDMLVHQPVSLESLPARGWNNATRSDGYF